MMNMQHVAQQLTGVGEGVAPGSVSQISASINFHVVRVITSAAAAAQIAAFNCYKTLRYLTDVNSTQQKMKYLKL